MNSLSPANTIARARSGICFDHLAGAARELGVSEQALREAVGGRPPNVRRAARVDVRDAPSGFRAFDRETALSLYVFSSYTYTLETIIQAGKRDLAVGHVPIGTNAKTRESRLFGSIAETRENHASSVSFHLDPWSEGVSDGEGPATVVGSALGPGLDSNRVAKVP